MLKKNKQKNNLKKQASKQAEKQTNIVSSFMFIVYSFKFNNNINNLLKEYLELRIKNKYNMSENIVNRLCNKLIQYSKTDNEKEEIILNAINGSWKDFYPLQNNNYSSKLQKREILPNSFKKEVAENKATDEEIKKLDERLKGRNDYEEK